MIYTKEQFLKATMAKTVPVYSVTANGADDQSRSEIGSVIKRSDGCSELVLHQFPTSTRVMIVDSFSPISGKNSEVVAVFEFEGGEARFPIGFASSDGSQTQITLSGKPIPGCKILIDEGLANFPSESRFKN